MYYVYILNDSIKNYIGYTQNLRERLKRHLSKTVYTTKRMINPKLIYYEAYINKELARNREKRLKQFGSSYVGLLKRIGLK